METEPADENVRICAVCNYNIDEDRDIATKIDGLWIGGSNCHKKYLLNRNVYSTERKFKLDKKQILYEEQKQAETGTTINCPQY